MLKEEFKKQLAEQHPELTEWLRKNSADFYEALGFWPGDEDAMVVALARLKRYFGDKFPMLKDGPERYWDHVVTAFVRGENVDTGELKTALVFLVQSYCGACDAIASFERKRREKPYHPRPPLPRRTPRPGGPVMKTG